MRTTTGVQELSEFMVSKYGVILAIMLLKVEYKYRFSYNFKEKRLIFIDDNENSKFFNDTHTMNIVLTENELRGLTRLINTLGV